MKNRVRIATAAVGLASLLILAWEAPAKPRPALPPLPERCLLSLRFNETNWWGDLRPAPLVFDNVQLVESWSGYALYAGSKRSSRLQYPIATLDEMTGRARTNLNLAVGSLRFWFCPDWTSSSLGGVGPGAFGRLAEAGAWTPDASYGWWGLFFSEDGDALQFSAQAGGQQADCLKTPIQFQAGIWHLITLTYGPKLSELYIDGELVTQGDAVTLWPDVKVQAAHGFSIGNDATGQVSAGGAFEEFTSFGYPLSPAEIAPYYKNTRPIADLGPISETEEQARLAWLAALREAAASSKQTAALEGGESLMSLLGYGTNDYGTNLWLEVRAETNLLFVVLHNTARCLDYQLLQATNGPGPPWELERLINGLDGQTEVTLNNEQWPSLFLQAVASAHEPAVGLSTTNLTYILGSGAQLLDPVAGVNYVPPLTGTNRLTITLATNAQAEDLLAIRDQGTGSGQIGRTNLNVTYSGTVIGTWTNGTGSSPLTINLYSNATSEAVGALLRNITYEYATTNPVFSDRRVEFTLADGCAGTNAPTHKTIHLLCPEAIDAMLVFDKSQSLSDSDFQTAKQAASNFVNHLDLPVDRVGLVSFAGEADLDHTLTYTGSVVQATLLSLITNRGTVFHPAFDLARSNLTETATNILRLMLLFSDGRVGNSNGTSTAEERATNTLLALAAAEEVKEAGIRLFTIAYGTNEAGTNLMKQFANSPQDYSYAPSAGEFAARFSAVAQMLCRRPSNAPPSVSITSPTNQSRFVAPTNLTVVASASDPDGTITEVQFFGGGQSIGEATQAPYTCVWTNAPLGTNQLRAVATDNHRLAVTSAPVTIVVLARPTVSLTSPTNGALLRTITPAVLEATASDADGIVTKVEFFTGQTKIAEDTNAPYSCTWSNAPAGTNYLRAVATDNDGLTNTSAVVTVTVAAPLPPTISITSPPNAAEWALFPPLPVKTHALDPDGIVTNVAFYIGTNFQAVVTNPPFHWNWSNAYQYGTYQIRAEATDNDGLSATSMVSVTVTGCTTISIQTVSLAPTNPFGGMISTGTVILNYPAENGGRAVRLAVSSTLVRVPPALYFAPGQRTNQFLIETSPVTVTSTVPVYSWVEQTPFFRKTNYVTLLPREGATVRPPPYCGKMDVAFVVDTSKSMGESLESLGSFTTNVESIVDHIEASSGGDYRLALVNFDGKVIGNNCGDFVEVQVVFEPRNRTHFSQTVSNLISRLDGCGGAEASDEALRTVIYGLSEGPWRTNSYGDPLQYGSFSTPFRTDARKLIILITDAAPGGADGTFSSGNDDVVAFQLAQAAWERGIQISCIDMSALQPVPSGIMREYSRVSYGVWVDGYRTDWCCMPECYPDINEALDEAFKAIFSQCGSSLGKMVLSRDEATVGGCPTFVASDTNKLARSELPVAFDTSGVTGRVSAVRLNRMGDLHRDFTGSFDFELGVSSASDTNLQCFGAVWINSLLTSAIPYEVEWQLARDFDEEVQPLLGKAVRLFPTDRVSGSCGTHYALYDTPAGQWPAVKNTLTLLVERPPDIPAGRCADLKLTEGDPPQICPWDIVFAGRVIASAARPNGWSLEDDHTPFEGVNLCVPANATIGLDYRVRSTGAQGPRSARFNVIVETSPTVPVLLPMLVTPSVVASNGDAGVTVSLDAPAPAQGAYVSLTGQGQTNLLLPAWLSVAPGEQSATFTLRGLTSDATLRASYNGLRESAVRVLASGGSSLQSPSITNITPGPGRVFLSWSAVSNATSYNVERALGSPTNFVTLYSGVTCTEITDFEVPSITNYCYRVRAVNAQTSSVPSASSCTSATNFVALTAPYIIPWGGTFYESVQVTLTNQPAGSSNMVTLDGSIPVRPAPGIQNPNCFRYTDAIVLTESKTLRAIGCLEPDQSGFVSAEFIILPRTTLPCSGSITSTLTRTSSLSTVRSGCYADQYLITNAVGKQVTLSMASTNFDTYLVFRETNGTILAQSDDTNGAGSRIVHTLPHTGEFIVEATTSEPGGAGTYSLTLACADVPELEVLHAGQLLPNHSTLDFGFSTLGSNVTKTLVIINAGTTNLVLGPMTISPSGQFTVSPTQLTNIPPNGSNSVTITFLALTNGSQTAELRFTSNDGDHGDGIENPFVLGLWAWGNPSGAAPLVRVTSPTNQQRFSAPTNLSITATSTPASRMQFYANGQFIGEDTANLGTPTTPGTNTVFTVPWTNGAGGTFLLEALAIDTTNRATRSTNVTVLFNWSPFAFDDDKKVAPASSSNVITALANDFDVDGSPITIVTNTQPTNGSVINRGTNLLYTPPTNFYGRTSFTYTIADTNGGSATATVHVGVRPQSAIAPPEASILWPTNGQEITSSITVTGSVSSAALDYWRLTYRGHGSGSGYKILAEGLTNVSNGPLAVFDPTLLLNGTYDLELTAVDLTQAAEQITVTTTITVKGNLKIGQFTLAFTDLQIPVSGLPLTVTRRYDSRDQGTHDFGGGWSLDVNTVRLEQSQPLAMGWEGTNQGGLSFCLGDPKPHLLTVTFPDGRLEQFRVAADFYGRGSCIGAWGPSWHYVTLNVKLLPGTTGSLALMGPTDIVVSLGEEGGANGPVTLHDFSGDPDHVFGPLYHPTGFIYTNLDGRQFEFDGQGTLLKMTDRNANSLTFTPDGAIHSSGRSVKFVRDASQRMTEIYDPNGLDASNNPAGPPALRYKYDSSGNLTHMHRLTDRSNAANPVYLTTTFFYENSAFPHYVTSIQDPRGVTGIRNEYDDNGRLTATIDALGNRTQYFHDLSNHVEIVIDRLGYATTHYYDLRGNVTATVNALRQTNRFTYDANNRVIQTIDPLGYTNAYGYDANGKRNAITNALGEVTRFEFDAFRQLNSKTDALTNTTSFEYSPAGNRTAVVDALGRHTSFAHDAHGRPTAVTNALNQLRAQAGSDANGSLQFVSEVDGLRMDFGYDANLNTTNTSFVWTNASTGQALTLATATEFDAAGRVTRVIEADNQSRSTLYDEGGRVKQSIGRMGDTNSYLYDAKGNLIETTYPDGTVSRGVYDANDRVTYTVDRHVPGVAANGSHSIYDALGRVVRSERLASVQIDVVETGNVAASVLTSAGQVLSASSTVYDAGGRVRFTTNAVSGVTEHQYDPVGRQTTVIVAGTNRTDFVYDAAGRLRFTTNTLGHLTQHEYDAKGRKIKTILPDNSYTTNKYDEIGRLVAVRDVMGRTNDLEYDTRGRLKAVVLPQVFNPEGATNARPRYEYDYDVYGNLTLIRDAKGRETKSTYDAFGQLLSRKLPLQQTNLQTYNALGQLAVAVDFKGQSNRLVYDALGRVATNLLYAAGATVAGRTNRFEYEAAGHYQRFIRPEGTNEIDRDLDGAVTNILSAEGWIRYEQDVAAGWLTNAYTTNTGVRYEYDGLGRLKTVSVYKRNGTNLPAPEMTTNTYTPLGSLQNVYFPNGTRTSYEYNRLNYLTNMAQFNSAGQLLARYAYTVASDGQRLAATETRREAGGTYSTNQITWTNDALRRLVRETCVSTVTGLSYTNAYVYDLVGNRLWKTNVSSSGTAVLGYTYNTNDQLLVESLTSGSFTNWYDANGSLTNRSSATETNRYSYDLEGRLTGATIYRTEAGQSLRMTNRYFYNAAGIRVRTETTRSVGGGAWVNETNLFLNDPQNLSGFSQVLEELTGAGTVPSATYTVGAQVLSQHKAGAVSHLMPDGLGSTRLLTDAGGAITNRFTYDAFGVPLDFTNSVVNAARTKMLYGGEQHDTGLNQYYLRARYYHQPTGRFGARDAAEGSQTSPLTLHRYAYVQNNPLNLRDPSGNETIASVSLSTTIALSLQLDYIKAVAKHGYVASKKATELGQSRDSILDAAAGRDASPETDSAVILVHGISHKWPGWSQSRETPFQQNLTLSIRDPQLAPGVGNDPLKHDLYEFNWGGFSIGGFGAIPIKSVHQMALVHLEMTHFLVWMQGYANIDLISHSWGTTLTCDLQNISGIETRHWVTMGSPLKSTTEKPVGNTGNWINLYDLNDPVVHLEIFPPFPALNEMTASLLWTAAGFGSPGLTQDHNVTAGFNRGYDFRSSLRHSGWVHGDYWISPEVATDLRDWLK